MTDDPLRAALERIDFALRGAEFHGSARVEVSADDLRDVVAALASVPDEGPRYHIRATDSMHHEHQRAARPAAAPALDVERQFADALVYWFDKTHGNHFGHDHHCPVRDDQPPDDRCTCGWSEVQRQEAHR